MKDIFVLRDNIALYKQVPSINVFGVVKSEGKRTKFTIAIPTYKRIKTLADAIESSLGQIDYNSFNIIVVDNNPERDDETEVFMRRYKDNPYIDYYKNTTNVGMAGNWNKCALLSTADNFILLHDDDVLSPYTLFVFDKVIDKIKGNWSIIKPELQSFNNIEQLKFNKPSDFILQSLSLLDFSTSCAVGPPTCILYNKRSYCNIGGCESDEEIYPCIDYINSLNLSIHSKAYRLWGCSLGGYRIGKNASLSEDVMNRYLMNNYYINIQVQKRCFIPYFLIKIILSGFFEYKMRMELDYYNMKSYKAKIESVDLYNLSPTKQKVIRKIWSVFVALYDKLLTDRQMIHLKSNLETI